MTTTRILTTSEICALADIIRAAQAGKTVARVDDEGRVSVGTARSIGDDRGNFLRKDEDVRDGWLRVTLDTGFDAFWPMDVCLPAYIDGELVLDYRR